MFGVPDGTDAPRVHGSRWWCSRCEVGFTARLKKACWNCLSDAHIAFPPTWSATSPRRYLTAPPPEEP